MFIGCVAVVDCCFYLCQLVECAVSCYGVDYICYWLCDCCLLVVGFFYVVNALAMAVLLLGVDSASYVLFMC